jgi:hypothetical protein
LTKKIQHKTTQKGCLEGRRESRESETDEEDALHYTSKLKMVNVVFDATIFSNKRKKHQNQEKGRHKGLAPPLTGFDGNPFPDRLDPQIRNPDQP